MSQHYGPNVATNGLIFCFDAANDQSYPRTGVTVYDITKTQIQATMTGSSAPTYSSASFGEFVFGGNGHIEIPHKSEMNLTTFSFCLWLKHTNQTLFWDRIASKKVEYTGTDGWEISLATGTDQTIYIGGSSGTFGTLANITNWTNPIWHYLVVCFVGNVAKIYLDGVYKGQTSTFTTPIANNRSLMLGRNIGPGEVTTQYRGSMGYVSMYNRELAADEVLQNFNAHRNRYKI